MNFIHLKKIIIARECKIIRKHENLLMFKVNKWKKI